jgi:Ca2+-binding RTX toxin-like protein
MDGGGNDDVVYGSEVDDFIRGGERLSGDDKLYGAGGNDRILGDGNDDQLFGQDGDDTLEGGDGFDDLNGGPGNDTCDGGDLRDSGAECERHNAIERGQLAELFRGI